MGQHLPGITHTVTSLSKQEGHLLPGTGSDGSPKESIPDELPVSGKSITSNRFSQVSGPVQSMTLRSSE